MGVTDDPDEVLFNLIAPKHNTRRLLGVRTFTGQKDGMTNRYTNYQPEAIALDAPLIKLTALHDVFTTYNFSVER